MWKFPSFIQENPSQQKKQAQIPLQQNFYESQAAKIQLSESDFPVIQQPHHLGWVP